MVVCFCVAVAFSFFSLEIGEDNHTYVGIGTLFCHLSISEHVTLIVISLTMTRSPSSIQLIHLSPSIIQDDDHLFPHFVASTIDCVATARKRLEWTAQIVFITFKKQCFIRRRHHQTLLPYWSCNCLSRHGSVFISKPRKRCDRQRRRAD